MEVWKNIGAICGAITSFLTILTFLYLKIVKKSMDRLVDSLVKRVILIINDEIGEKIETLEKDVEALKEKEERNRDIDLKRVSFNRCLIRSISLLLRKFEGEKLNGEVKEELKNLNDYLINNVL
jgi:hypothetical protein